MSEEGKRGRPKSDGFERREERSETREEERRRGQEEEERGEEEEEEEPPAAAAAAAGEEEGELIGCADLRAAGVAACDVLVAVVFSASSRGVPAAAASSRFRVLS